jgi:hypothetical protein
MDTLVEFVPRLLGAVVVLATIGLVAALSLAAGQHLGKGGRDHVSVR